MEVQGISENFPDVKGDCLMGSTTSSMLKDYLPTLSLEEDQTIIESRQELKEVMFFHGKLKSPRYPRRSLACLRWPSKRQKAPHQPFWRLVCQRRFWMSLGSLLGGAMLLGIHRGV